MTAATKGPADCRSDFPMLQATVHGKPLIYLDSAATAQKPTCVIDAESEFYRSQYGTVHRAVYSLAQESTAAHQAVRQKVADLINAPSTDQIIFTRGTTDGINLVASSFGKLALKPGDEVLISAIEHHANIVPWQMVCEERGAVLKVIPVLDDGSIDFDGYESLLSDRTRLVAISHVSNALGTRLPVEAMCRLAKGAGAVVLVDGAQAAPHQPVDVQAIGCDFYVFSGHKMYGPTGVGVLYGSADLLDRMPPYQGGGDMIETVTFEKTTYNRPPLKFEAGTPMIAQVIGLGAAIDYLQEIGMEAIEAHGQELLRMATERLSTIDGLRVIGTAPDKGPIIGFIIEGVHPLDLGTMLDFQGVAVRTGHHCAQPTMARFGLTATTRASFGLYNTLDDVDHFVAALEAVLPTLR